MSELVRIAIIGDTHMPRRARALPAACEAALREADLTLHTGDFVDAGTLALVEATAGRLVAVHGNVDSPELRDRLPERTEVELGASGSG